MKTYLIICQLGFPEETYTNLVAYLKTSTYWARPVASAWLIKTTAEASKIRDGVKDRINAADKVLVISVPSKDWATYKVDKVVTDWMKNNL